jgi:hypothetical protein
MVSMHAFDSRQVPYAAGGTPTALGALEWIDLPDVLAGGRDLPV